jgi:DNA-directed RNA polymerase specialized sigma24 family protein
MRRASINAPVKIEQEIDGLLLLSGDERIERAKIRDRSDQRYVSSEAILYFMRRTRLDNSERNFETLYRVLISRIRTTLPGRGREAGTLDAAAERAASNVESRFIDVLVADRLAYDNRLDFFEVHFNEALLGLRQTALKKMFKEKSREAPAAEDVEVSGGFQRSGKPYSPTDPQKYSDPLYRIRLLEAISALPSDQRQVMFLDIKGFQYTSKDPTASTIGSLVGCSEQTARNRRDRAHKALRIALEGDDE